ncbi:COP9 signalosome complex subunit 1b-like [Drosophila subobscura]|uniref:COP9 signalosome complex subunit 1b-like n=1 Tax=Drosophila subobscura TaxID=7241 RepID=UPI00155A47B7|nr:COP9 signalosome complex subunit 1b-like [Drosophila subobscura]
MLPLSPQLMQNDPEPLEVDAPPNEQNANNEVQHIVVENPSIDLEVYAHQYNGFARLHRLKYVAEVCPSLAVEALKMAIPYVLTTYNVSLYQLLQKRLSDLSHGAPASADSFAYDAYWVNTIVQKSDRRLHVLDVQLRSYKSTSFKESIRRGHEDLAEHYLSCGDLTNALQFYSRDRDYCTSGEHELKMCLNMIKVFIYMQNWGQIMTNITKVESSSYLGKEANAQLRTHLSCAAGLAEMQLKKYKAAAEHFLNANFDHFELPEMISTNNVAVYGGLCALATFDRPELRRLLSSQSFKHFLEMEPQLRDIVVLFHESKYASCLTLLDEIRDNLLIDIYMAPHVGTLYTQIRKRAMIQYFSPYMSADMHKMAVDFKTSVGDLENEVMQLILDDQIQARIDSHNKILYAKESDQRNITMERALALGKSYQRNTRMLILRAAMRKSGIQVKSDGSEDGSKHNARSALLKYTQ